MVRFQINNLPTLIKTVHNAQKIWRKQNWEKSIIDQDNNIEKVLEILNLYGKWKNKFHGDKIAEKIMPEIFADGINGLHFALLGLYKYANMCLRSQMESALRMIYFIDHKIEYDWWLNDNEWYINVKQKYVWGSDFTYFKQLSKIDTFDQQCNANKKIYSGRKTGDLLKRLYAQLSKSIHTSADHFQTSTGRYSPKYDEAKFQEWIKNCNDLQCYIMISLILAFPDIFKKMTSSEQDSILNKAIVDLDYIQKIQSVI
ncbi:MAG: hypothetical protein KAT28_01110 [Candidatus Aenigmarchaeota archaeon]|nr:hypothetical protein [Candidatus Aenigmarchaeota archaeon]